MTGNRGVHGHRHRRSGWKRFALPGLLCAWLVTAASSAATAPSEPHLRALFVYKFTTMIEWPGEALGADDEPFSICLLGADPTEGEMQRSVSGQKSHQRTIAVRELAAPAADAPCQVAYVAFDDADEQRRALDHYGGTSTLTVSHLAGFADEGGMIELVTESDRIRFRINQGAIERAGLSLDSKLLRLAVDVLR